MIGIAVTFVVLILAGVAVGRVWAQTWCVPLYVSSCGPEILGLVFSCNANIPSTEIAIMPQLGCAQQTTELLRKKLSPMFPPNVNGDRETQCTHILHSMLCNTLQHSPHWPLVKATENFECFAEKIPLPLIRHMLYMQLSLSLSLIYPSIHPSKYQFIHEKSIQISIHPSYYHLSIHYPATLQISIYPSKYQFILEYIHPSMH